MSPRSRRPNWGIASSINDDAKPKNKPLNFGDGSRIRTIKAMTRKESQKGKLKKKLKFQLVKFTEFLDSLQSAIIWRLVRSEKDRRII